MSKQQTAVEWLKALYDSRPAYEEFLMEDEFEQAKLMEKKQIEKSYEDGFMSSAEGWNGEMVPHYDDFNLDTDKYYNETYGKETDSR